MKKSIFVISIALVLSVLLSGCSITIWPFSPEKPLEFFSKTYTAQTEFYYSSDAGKTYGNRTKEFKAGEAVYMQVIIKVETNRRAAETVKATLSIPNMGTVSSSYYDGPMISTINDLENNVTQYILDIPASKKAGEQSFVFQFIPNEETEIKMLLTYEEKIDNLYDVQNTVKFIE